MRPVAEVRRLILDSVPRLGVESIQYTEAVGRVLAASVVSGEDVPSFANSSMDGYAVRGVDVTRPGATLDVLADIPAGNLSDLEVGEGQALKIMTGAPIPLGADTVVRVEETTSQDGTVHVRTAVETGTYVRPAGGDIRVGETVIEAGTRLGPTHVGVMAALGVVSPAVALRPRIGLMSTGDELQPPDTPVLAPAMIRDSNRPMMAAMLDEAGAEVMDLGRIADEADAIRAALKRAAATSDGVLTSGGVSMGDYDVIKAVLQEEAGVEFLSVAMNPGKPLGFGTLAGRPFFGLPGNPVSVFVSFEQFVRPALLAMQGARAVLRPRVMGVAGEDFRSDPEKEAFARVSIVDHDTLEVLSTGGQASNVLSGAGRADCLAVLPVGVDVVSTGEPITLELFKAAETRSSD